MNCAQAVPEPRPGPGTIVTIRANANYGAMKRPRTLYLAAPIVCCLLAWAGRATAAAPYPVMKPEDIGVPLGDVIPIRVDDDEMRHVYADIAMVKVVEAIVSPDQKTIRVKYELTPCWTKWKSFKIGLRKRWTAWDRKREVLLAVAPSYSRAERYAQEAGEAQPYVVQYETTRVPISATATLEDRSRLPSSAESMTFFPDTFWAKALSAEFAVAPRPAERKSQRSEDVYHVVRRSSPGSNSVLEVKQVTRHFRTDLYSYPRPIEKIAVAVSDSVVVIFPRDQAGTVGTRKLSGALATAKLKSDADLERAWAGKFEPADSGRTVSRRDTFKAHCGYPWERRVEMVGLGFEQMFADMTHSYSVVQGYFSLTGANLLSAASARKLEAVVPAQMPKHGQQMRDTRIGGMLRVLDVLQCPTNGIGVAGRLLESDGGDSSLREYAVLILAGTADNRADEVLRSVLTTSRKGKGGKLARQALSYLLLRRDPASVAPAIECLQAAAAGKLKPVYPVLIMRGYSLGDFVEIIEPLRMMQAKEAMPALLSLHRVATQKTKVSGSGTVAWACSLALAAMGHADGLRLMTSAVGEGSGIRSAGRPADVAVAALDLPSSRGEDLVASVLTHEDAAIRRTFLAAVSRSIKDRPDEGRALAVQLASRIRMLAEKDPADDVRKAASKALAAIEPKKATPLPVPRKSSRGGRGRPRR